MENENKKVRNLAAAIQAGLNEARQAFEAGLAEADEEVNQALAVAERQRSLNENLLRIAKERANAQRGITPKMEHAGYILLNAEQYAYIHTDNGYNHDKMVFSSWRVRLQTPYSVGLFLENVSVLITDDIIKTVGGMMGITGFRDINEMTINNVKKLWNVPDNFIF